MLTGLTPFRGDSVMDVLEQVRTQDALPPSRLQPKVPRDLETICLKCLQKEPLRRYASGQELADDLRRFLDGQPILARPVGLVERSIKWARRRPAAAALVAAGLLLVGLIAGYNAYLQYALEEKCRETVEANRRTALSEVREKVQEILLRGEVAFNNRKYDQTPLVRIFDGVTGVREAQFLAFSATFRGGVRVGTLDVNGDGRLDILASSGKGRIGKAFDRLTRRELDSFFAYDSPYDGVFLAGG